MMMMMTITTIALATFVNEKAIGLLLVSCSPSIRYPWQTLYAHRIHVERSVYVDGRGKRRDDDVFRKQLKTLQQCMRRELCEPFALHSRYAQKNSLFFYFYFYF